ncbi:MAG: glucuronyl esterase domain-containing protein [Limisphaerales bacterium]
MKIRIVLCFLLATVIAARALPPVSELPARSELPDALTMFDGTKVTSKSAWLKKRRPELKDLFQHYEYGQFPAPRKITAHVELTDTNCFGGKATLKLVTVRFGQPEPHIDLMVVTPNHNRKPAPVFLGMNFSGNYGLVTNTYVPLPRGSIRGKVPVEESRGKYVDVWAIEQSIDRGYAVATLFCNDVEPDEKDPTNGVRELVFDQNTGTIAAWAWGLHRCVDYLVTNRQIDKHRIFVVGHSRLGKTAIVAAAFDDRIAMAIPLQSGTGGAAPSRGNKQSESVTRINTTFPHWFNAEFKKFNDQPERLPFEQHCLIALCAPRPVLVGCAAEDLWANPAGQFEMVKAADNVYRLLGTDGFAATTMPAVNHVVDNTLGYFIRPGKHSMTKADWNVFLDYADKHFGKPK